MLKRFTRIRVLLLVTAALLVHLAGATGGVSASDCIPDGGTDDTLRYTDCCSGYAVPNSTWCDNPADWGTTWESCHHICGSATGECDQYDSGSCDYSWNPYMQCCAAPDPSPGISCPTACLY